MKRLLVVLAATLSIVGCGKSSTLVSPTTTIAPDGNYVVSGTVVAEDGALPLAGADVIATSGQYSRTSHTDDTGGFVLDRLTAGDWTINVVKRGYLSDAKLVSLADADATIAFSLAVDNEPTHPERPEPLARRK